MLSRSKDYLSRPMISWKSSFINRGTRINCVPSAIVSFRKDNSVLSSDVGTCTIQIALSNGFRRVQSVRSVNMTKIRKNDLQYDDFINFVHLCIPIKLFLSIRQIRYFLWIKISNLSHKNYSFIKYWITYEILLKKQLQFIIFKSFNLTFFEKNFKKYREAGKQRRI